MQISAQEWRAGEVAGSALGVLRGYVRGGVGNWVMAVRPRLRHSDRETSFVGPRIAVVDASRLEDDELVGAPDLSIEVLSGTHAAGELFEQALEYLAAGGKQVWIVDPDSERVVVVDPPNQFRVVGREDTLDGGAALPGFSCLVSELFE